MKKGILYISSLICILGLLIFLEIQTEASSLNDITLSPDGKAFSTNVGDKNYIWYPDKHTIYTGVTTSLRALENGEHNYKSTRDGIIPIERWEVNHVPAQCIHDAHMLLGYYHGISYGKSKCMRPYNSGWFGYCADCKRQVTNMLIYMNEATAYSFKNLNLNLDYYYLCPHDDCNNLEQGSEFVEHYCNEISWNRYYIRYNTNKGSGQVMRRSIHMYNNETIYEGIECTPDTKLRKNTYKRIGYEFIGWNTKADGSGDWLSDGQEVYNLTSDNEVEIMLYAQWKKSESTLNINPNGGSYLGNTGITSVIQDYNSTYLADSSKITPPTGYTVIFNDCGGNPVNPIIQTCSFSEWKLSLPFVGKLVGNTYTYLGSQGNTDTIIAQYAYNSITLPPVYRNGYSFGGWYYDASYSKFAGKAGGTITPTSNITLYAKWVDLLLISEDNYNANSGKGAVNLSWSQSDGNTKAYCLYQSLDATNWNKIAGATDISETFNANQSYSYTGNSSTYTVPYTGLYSLTAYGAQGGNASNGKTGGKGGYVTCNTWLTKGEVITVIVGGQNGYNGGGSATNSNYGNGGGYTIISSNLKGVLLIAGGGGGATTLAAGYPGGSTANNISGRNGQSGAAGGGGGNQGGASGHVMTHACSHNGSLATTNGVTYAVSSGGCYTSPYALPLSCTQTVTRNRIEGSSYPWKGSCTNCGRNSGVYFFDTYTTSHSACGTSTPSTSGVVCPGCGRFTSGSTVPAVGITTHTYYVTVYSKSCLYSNGQVVSSASASGGSNYVNTGHMVSYSSNQDAKTGNGAVSIISSSIGYLTDQSLNNVTALDKAAPNPINFAKISKQAISDTHIKVSWSAPADNGTKYYHMARSYEAGSLKEISTSNVTENTLISGVDSYYYVINTTPDTTVTTSSTKTSAAFITINLTADLQYLHVACMDKAGNLSSTIHIPIGKTDPEVAWNVFTEQIWITQQDSVHPAAEANSYFIRCNGDTPFILKYNSYLDGIARDNYQINHSIIEYQASFGEPVQLQVTTPSIPVTYETVTKKASDLIKTISGEMLIEDAGYTVTERSNWCKNLSIVQKFTMHQEADGIKIRLTPIAGADFKSSTIYSNYNNDIGNSIYLIGDCTPPEIKGLEELDKITVIDMEEDDYTLTFTASDSGSGVREFYAVITNLDNGINEKFVSDNGSSLTMSITDDKALFVGDFEVVLYAVDNVGNVASESSGATEFTLKAYISRVLSPHDPVFKRGESGILHITTTGYVNKVEVIFPDKLLGLNPDLSQTYIYEVPSYIQIEEYVFVIPLYAPEEGYEVIVKAYKNGTTLEERPKFNTVEITGSILDEIRVRIR